MSHRLEQVSEVIRHELNNLFLTEIELPKNTLVTIVKVVTSKDLRHAKVYLSIIPAKYTGKVLEKLKANLGHLQYLLNQKLSIKPLPRLSLAIDQTEQEASRIEELLDRIKETG